MSSLYIGSKLKNSALWKKVDLLTNVLAIIISAIITILKAMDVPFAMSEQQIIVVSGALAVLVLSIHGLITIITSDKVGLDRRVSDGEAGKLLGLDRRAHKNR